VQIVQGILLLGIYIPTFGQISVKLSVFGVLYCTLIVVPMGVKFGIEE